MEATEFNAVVKQNLEDGALCQTRSHTQKEVLQAFGECQKPRRRLFPEATMKVLRNWLYEHRFNAYPSEAEKRRLSEQTNLTFLQISYWFTNARKRLLPEILKEGVSRRDRSPNSGSNTSRSSISGSRNSGSTKSRSNTSGSYNSQKNNSGRCNYESRKKGDSREKGKAAQVAQTQTTHPTLGIKSLLQDQSMAECLPLTVGQKLVKKLRDPKHSPSQKVSANKDQFTEKVTFSATEHLFAAEPVWAEEYDEFSSFRMLVDAAVQRGAELEQQKQQNPDS